MSRIGFDTLCASYRMGEHCRRKVASADWLESPDRPTNPDINQLRAFANGRSELRSQLEVLEALHDEWLTGRVEQLDESVGRYEKPKKHWTNPQFGSAS